MKYISAEDAEKQLRDKANWGKGPWQTEPDRLEFEHAGFPCLLRRNTQVSGAWCGYVAVPEDHPYFEKGYKDCEVDVHGGLTYAEHCQGNICHKPEPGESDKVWWLGFDCAHVFDLMPAYNALEKFTGSKFDSVTSPLINHYWTLEEVKAETCRLADQLKALWT